MKKSPKILTMVIAAALTTSSIVPQVAFAANKQNIKFDINVDGKIDNVDLNYVQFMSKIKSSSPEYSQWKDYLYKGDLDADGEVTFKDVQLIKDYISEDYSKDYSKDDDIKDGNKSSVSDVNGDGKIDNMDLKYVEHMATIKIGSPEYNQWEAHLYKGDFDKDGEVTDKDVSIMRQFLDNGGNTLAVENEESTTENEESTTENNQLDEKEQTEEKKDKDDKLKITASDKIRNAILNFENRIYLDEFENMNKETLMTTFYDVVLENPILELYVAYGEGKTAYICDFDRPYMKVEYNYSQNQTNRMVNEINNEIDRIIKANIKPDMSDHEKVKALYDYIILNTEYDTRYAMGKCVIQYYSVYDVIIKHIGENYAYTNAMELLLDKAGIESEIMYGMMNKGYAYGIFRRDESHCWNLVKLDGKYYHIDASFDDVMIEVMGKEEYSNFLVTDDYMKESRNWR